MSPMAITPTRNWSVRMEVSDLSQESFATGFIELSQLLIDKASLQLFDQIE